MYVVVCRDFVIRRVGGLEVHDSRFGRDDLVIRRVGGLEGGGEAGGACGEVIRRVGGLEDMNTMELDDSKVIRRVGGLEVSGRTPSHFIGITPFRGQLPTTPKERRRPTSK